MIFRVLIDILQNFEIELQAYSIISCKIIRYLKFAIGSISGWLLVEKYLSIKYPTCKLINDLKLQIFLIIFCIAISNLALYPSLLLNAYLQDE